MNMMSLKIARSDHILVIWLVIVIIGIAVVKAKSLFYVGGETIFRCPVDVSLSDDQISRSTYVISKTDTFKPYSVKRLLKYDGEKIVSSHRTLGEATISFHPPVLRLKHLKLKDTGLYKCVANFRGLRLKTAYDIDVQAMPSKIYTAKIATTVEENGNYAAHICVATGAKPPARVKWVETDTNNTCDFVETTTYDNNDLSVTTKAVLRLPPGRIEGSLMPALQEKSYTCVVKHLGFRVARKEAVNVTLMYIPGPVTISTHPNQPKKYDDVSLKCKSTCVPKCTFKWFHNGEFLSSGSKLHLTSITEQEAGNSSYRCTAETKVGSTSGDVRIRLSQDSAGFHSKSQEEDAAENRLTSIGFYIAATAGGLILCGVLIALLVKMHHRTQKLTYAINGSESTESKADSNDDDYGIVGDCTTQPFANYDRSNTPSTAEETLSGPTDPPTPDDFHELLPPEQNIGNFIGDVPTLSDSFHHTFRDILSPAYGHATVDRRFSSRSSRDRPLPLCEPTRFSTLPRNSTRYTMSGPSSSSRDYYSRPPSADRSRPYTLQPSIPENRPFEMTEPQPWMPRAVGSILSVRPSHPDDAMMDASLTVATEV